MIPPTPAAPTREEAFRSRVQEFGDNLYTEWEPHMLDEIAAAANASPEITGDDLRKFGSFLNQIMARVFGVGVTAAIKAYPKFMGGVLMAPPSLQPLDTAPRA